MRGAGTAKANQDTIGRAAGSPRAAVDPGPCSMPETPPPAPEPAPPSEEREATKGNDGHRHVLDREQREARPMAERG